MAQLECVDCGHRVTYTYIAINHLAWRMDLAPMGVTL